MKISYLSISFPNGINPVLLIDILMIIKLLSLFIFFTTGFNLVEL